MSETIDSASRPEWSARLVDAMRAYEQAKAAVQDALGKQNDAWCKVQAVQNERDQWIEQVMNAAWKASANE